MRRFVVFMGGRKGRVVRSGMGLAMIAAGASAGGGWWALAAFGVLPLATGVLDLCPIAPLMRLPVAGKAFRACTVTEGRARR
ncbi:hypothetical protein GCM10023205_17940 [Yinghuangia aomiensis]|uniref:Inner membrane protein YgaP-like transmembrane domain-containing protein n=1 Tax=Yinghuangia aomiensis TaxID=676205 RepID=A0ABP9GXM3_9ACTN